MQHSWHHRPRPAVASEDTPRAGHALWTKLAALVLIPLLAVGALALLLTHNRLAESSSAEKIVTEAAVTRDVEVLVNRMAIQWQTLYSRHSLASFFHKSPLAALIVQTQIASYQKTINGEAKLVAHDVAATPAFGSLSGPLTELAHMSVASDEGQTAARQAMPRLVTELQDFVDQTLNEMTTQAGGLAGGSALVRHIQADIQFTQLDADGVILWSLMVERFGAATAQRAGLDGEIRLATSVVNTDLARVRLIAKKVLTAKAEAQVESTATAGQQTAAFLLALPITKPLGLSYLTTLASKSGALGATAVIVDDQTAEAVTEGAARVHHNAERTAALTALLIGLLLLVTVGLTYRLYRAINTPLVALAVRARQISAGQLELGAERGTPEITAVGMALNEAIQNLRQLKTQAEALAEGELDHPSLREAIPGRLGESFYRSVVRAADLQSQLHYKAGHDALTGLLNRSSALEILGSMLEDTGMGPEQVGVMYVDLDGFKRINDTKGHNIGDQVLRVTAGRLAETIGPQGDVCRLGGDEFVVVVRGVENTEHLRALGWRLIRAVEADIAVGANLVVNVGASVGIAVSGSAVHDSASGLLAEADVAVYRAKAAGRAQVVMSSDLETGEEAFDAATKVTSIVS